MSTRTASREPPPKTFNYIPRLALVILALAFLFAGHLSWNGLWGFNHLRFLPLPFHVGAWIITVLLIGASLLPRLDNAASRIVARGTEMFFGSRRWWWRIGLAVASGTLFWLLRADTHFLGDGRTWLANFSHEAGYVRKWAEFGSIPLVRNVQGLLGGYNRATAEMAFQVVSVISGVVVLLGLFPLVERLVQQRTNRFAATAILIFSGAGLLFFGYVEFYPVLWALVVLFLLAGIIWLQDRKERALVIAVVLYALALAMHIQVTWLFGALLLLLPGLIARPDGEINVPRIRWLLAVTVIGALGIYWWVVTSPPSRAWMVLPPLSGRVESPEYAVVSPKHLFDILNLVLVLFPGALMLVIGRLRKGGPKPDAVSAFLAAGSVGGLLFVLLLNPVIGLGRDWDLMSLAVLPPVLWIFYRIDRDGRPLGGRVALGLALLALLTGGTYYAANLRTESSEERYLSLLRWYGGKDYNGWKSFQTYLAETGKTDKAARLAEEMQRVFPRHASLGEGWRVLQAREPAAAQTIAEQLVREDPGRAEYIHLLGEALAAQGHVGAAEQKLWEALRNRPEYAPAMRSLAQLRMGAGDFDAARDLLRKARYIDPGAEPVLEDLGGVYLRLNNLDSAGAVGDTLLLMDSRSPGGHLIKMLVALQQGDQASARQHFLAYREYGHNRPEYLRIVAACRDLVLND